MKTRWVVLAVIAVALVVAWIVWVGPFLAQDRCLDDGGSWQDRACEGMRSSG